MPIFNQEQAQYFIDLLTKGDGSLLTWQVYYDPKDGTERKDLAKWYNAPLSDCGPAFKQAESDLCGVYFCINEMDGHGRNAFNTRRIRALFADFDGIEEPEWPLTPHFVTKRDNTHGHAFWLVNDVEVDQFMYLQKRISIICNTDGQVTDPSRVARLPGTGHFKNPASPQMYSVAWDNTKNVPDYYSINDIYDTFDLSGENLTEYEKWVGTRDRFDEGTGFKDDDVYIKKYITYLINNAQPAVDGDGGTMGVIKAASFGFDYGITLETCQELMWEHFNPRCEPPWEIEEKEHFELSVARAYKYAKNAPGCRTAGANFDPVPPPPPKPLPIEVMRDGDRLDKDSAAILSPMLNGKSSHYELAQCFDGIVYDGVNIIRYMQIFYVFNGRSWSAVPDDNTIKAGIQKFYSRFKPADSLVSSTFKSFKDLVTINLKDLQNGTWLDSGKEDNNILCFKNNLVNLTAETPVVMPHTVNYFTFNELEYDYVQQPMGCPKFLQFLSSVWPNDPDLILQLQEWMGYCLTTDVNMQKFALFLGKSGAGKGVLSDVISEMVGRKNTIAPPLSKFMSDSTLHNMSMARLALIPDAHSVHPSKRDDILSGIKAITGCDPMTYHVMYKGAQTSIFKLKIMMSTNNMPEFVDASGALSRRMLVFPFTITFQGREDANLRDKLISEMSGIVQWSLQGLNRLRCNGRFTEAGASLTEKENIKDDMNPLARFIEDVCEVSTTEFVCGERLYDAYLLWCKQHKIHSPLSQNKLTRILKATDLPILQERKRVDGKRQIGFSGINVVAFPGIEKIEDTNINNV